MTSRFNIIFLLLIIGCTYALFGLLLPGCAAKQERLRGVEYYYQEGMKALDRKRDLEAVEMFQRVVSNFPGSALVADAQFHLAEAYFRMEDFVNAIAEYQRLIDSYPNSNYIERAQFQIGESHFKQMRSPEHDQKETYDALTYFRYFIEDNPQSPFLEKAQNRIISCRSRLARKQYLAAQQYHDQGYLEAATIGYEDLVRSFPDTRWYHWGKAQLGKIAYNKGDLELAHANWQEVESDSEDEKLQNKVGKWLREIQPAEAE